MTVISDHERRLIEAAPALYEACLAALRYDRSIIGKAVRGEYDLRKDGHGVTEGEDLDNLYLDWMTKARAAVATVAGEGTVIQ